jgi:hypothetical protein
MVMTLSQVLPFWVPHKKRQYCIFSVVFGLRFHYSESKQRFCQNIPRWKLEPHTPILHDENRTSGSEIPNMYPAPRQNLLFSALCPPCRDVGCEQEIGGPLAGWGQGLDRCPRVLGKLLTTVSLNALVCEVGVTTPLPGWLEHLDTMSHRPPPGGGTHFQMRIKSWFTKTK